MFCRFIPFKIRINVNRYKWVGLLLIIDTDTDIDTDTTFQLSSVKNRPTTFPHSLSVRVFAPYSARHLDWYVDPNNITPCQEYYQLTSSDISHWNKKQWNADWNNKPIPDL